MRIEKPTGFMVHRKAKVYCGNIAEYLGAMDEIRRRIKDDHYFKKAHQHWLWDLPEYRFHLEGLTIENVASSSFRKMQRVQREFSEPLGVPLFRTYRPVMIRIHKVDFQLTDSTGKITAYATPEDTENWGEVARFVNGNKVNVVISELENKVAYLYRISKNVDNE